MSITYSDNVCLCLCVCVCLYSCLSYPESNSHASYYIVLCWVSGSIVPHYFEKNDSRGKKKLLNTMCVLIFSTTFV